MKTHFEDIEAKCMPAPFLKPEVGLTFVRPSQSNKQSHSSTHKRNVCSTY